MGREVRHTHSKRAGHLSPKTALKPGTSMLLSVVISTCNRQADLQRCIDSLQRAQLREGRSCEIIVVDNNSADGTAALVRECAKAAHWPVRYVFEGRQGKSFALNTGLASVSGEVVAFTDDDTIVPADWLEVIADTFSANPEVACVGGMVQLFNAEDAPVSIQLASEASIVRMTNFAVDNIPIMGCNMAMRAEVLRKVGAFDTRFGPGTSIGAAEDLDYLYRVLEGGFAIHYIPEIMLFHNHGRRSHEQLERLTRSYVTGRGAFYGKYLLRRDRRVLRWAYWELAGLIGWRWISRLFSSAVRREMRAFWLLLAGAGNYVLWHRGA